MDAEFIEERFGAELKNILGTLHSRPELSLEERETTALIRRTLSSLGVRLIDLGMETGCVGVLSGGKPGPTIGLRADIDALPQQEKTDRPDRSAVPGVMHACGHDVHTTGLLGAAMALCAVREQLAGNVVFLFQPAEETLSGARLMLDRGLMEKAPMDMLFGLHNSPQLPAGTVGVREGHLMAAKDRYLIRVTGRGGHSSAPHKNIDPVVAAAAMVSAVHTVVSRNVGPLHAAVVNVGYLSAGSPEDMVVDEAVLGGTVRTHEEKVRRRVFDRLAEIAEGTARAYGCGAALTRESIVPAVNNPREMAAVARRAAVRTVGEGNIAAPALNMASEDFALFAERVPAFFYFLGSGTPGGRSPSWHSPYFCAHEKTHLYGAALMANSVLCAMDKGP